MSTPLEHDYIGLAENPSTMDGTSDKLSSSEDGNRKTKSSSSSLNYKETELRLGLPGCESPERKSSSSSAAAGVSLFGKDLHSGGTTPLKAGAKRVFSDAIDIDASTAKWGLSVTDGSEAELGKASASAALFSPRGANVVKPLVASLDPKTSTQQANNATAVAQTVKEGAMVPQSADPVQEKNPQVAPAAKAQVVGWPPIRSFRKNTMASNLTKNNDEAEGKPGFGGCLYVKVSMDGAPYLRKVDLKTYNNYKELSSALEKMFTCFTIGQCNSAGLPGKDGLSESSLRDLLHGSEYVLTYEDKDGDWMLVGDVPWGMFADSCRRLRIMKGSEAIGLAPRAVEKSRSQN